MRVSEIELSDSGGRCRLRALVRFDTHWVWGDEPFELWYSFPSACAGFLTAENGDPFLAALLAPAMALGEDLEIGAPVSPKLLAAVPRIQEIYRCWEPELAPSAVAAPPRTAGLPAPDGEPGAANGEPGAALFFSMGVDSSYSLLRSTASPAAEERVTHLIVAEGLDIYLWEAERYPPLLASAGEVAREFGTELLPVTTNLRDVSDRVVDWVKLYFGAALASIPLALGRMFDSVRIAAAQTYALLVPDGSHPLLDPLWGTEDVRFLHDGLEADRLAKIRSIAASPVLVGNLRVCTTGEVTSAYNCGSCEKCVRTMIGLHIAGALGSCRTLPQRVDPELVRGLDVRKPIARQYLRQLVAALGSSEEDLAIKAALEAVLSRHREQLTGTG